MKPNAPESPFRDPEPSDPVYCRLLGLARRDGLEVIEVTMPERFRVPFRGLLAFGDRLILISQHFPENQRARTLAHELGHWRLHTVGYNVALYHEHGDYHDSLEAEASRFADRMLRLVQKRFATHHGR